MLTAPFQTLLGIGAGLPPTTYAEIKDANQGHHRTAPSLRGLVGLCGTRPVANVPRPGSDA
jgi:hypothetical protein